MGFNIDSSWYERPQKVKERVSAGGVVVRVENGQAYVGLAREGDYPLYVLPKGGIEDGESLEETARREIEEEAGLSDLELVEYLGTRERLNYARTRWMTVHYYLFRTCQVAGKPTDPKHTNGVAWFRPDALPSMLWPEQQALLEELVERIQALARG